jgi:hypothetical protein
MGVTHEGQGKGNVKIIKVETQGEKREEVIVRHEIVPPKRKTWSYENVSREWNRTL